jgi:hypothetical protein
VAESEEVAESEGLSAQTGGAGLGASLAVALNRRKRKGEEDPELDDFLREQTTLARLQSEHLHEQRTLVLARLRWGRFSDRMKALLQVMTALVGAGVVVLIASMAWTAHEAKGLVIEAFSTPPDLAQSGLTGQVAASRFLDQLQTLQSATATSDRPAESYESNWGSDFKVEIPETGLTFSEFDKLLRERLGHLTHVSGEVVTTPQGISVTVRMGDAPPRTFTGLTADYDDLARKAAEAVYRQSQPYRYGEYLEKSGRIDEAYQVISDLAAHGPDSERGWAYAKLALLDLNYHGDAAQARRHSALGMGFGGGSDLNDYIAKVNTEVWSGHEQQDLEISRKLDAMSQKRQPGTSDFFFLDNKLLGRAWLLFVEPDYLASAAAWEQVYREDHQTSMGQTAPEMAAAAYALGHDLPAARHGMETSPDLSLADHAWAIALGAFPAWPAYYIPAEAGDWPQALAAIRQLDAQLEADKAKKPIYGLMQQVWTWPLEAVALANAGDVEGAQALAAKTPVDCYPCQRARGLVAMAAKDWAGAERAFAEAARQAPSLPQAYAEWGRAQLERGSPQGAITQAMVAAAKAPRFADAPQLWGEGLLAQGDFKGAVKKFEATAKLAPHWARPHLKLAEALARMDRREEARSELMAASAMDLTPAERAEAARLSF